MKLVILSVIMFVTSLGLAGTLTASEPGGSIWLTPSMLCEVPTTTWLYYTTPREHEQKRKEEEAQKSPCPTYRCCHDARVTIRVDLARPCYNEQGLKAFAALFSAAAERGVENASIRALNQIEVESGGEKKK